MLITLLNFSLHMMPISYNEWEFYKCFKNFKLILLEKANKMNFNFYHLIWIHWIPLYLIFDPLLEKIILNSLLLDYLERILILILILQMLNFLLDLEKHFLPKVYKIYQFHSTRGAACHPIKIFLQKLIVKISPIS